MLDHVTSAETSNRPKKIDSKKLQTHMSPDMVLIDALKWRSHPYLYATPMWATWLNIWKVKKRVFIGKTHKNYCIFYHTDLSLMTAATAKETRNWMKEKGYEVMWIWPEMDIFTSNPVLKSYRSCPHGNIPKLCNLDYCLKIYICIRQWIVMLGIHIHSINYIRKGLVFQLLRM